MPWESILLRLILAQYNRFPGSWISRRICQLSEFHEKLAKDFDALLNQYQMSVINYYQDASELDKDDIVSMLAQLVEAFLNALFSWSKSFMRRLAAREKCG